ncbi:MAG: VCBS repeat-containing protein [Alphaproteobacteria bacterium]|nr:VCBS repeat-containing protein [Alphaproteobacteria bacterium]
MTPALAAWLAGPARADWPIEPLASATNPVGLALADIDEDGTSDVVFGEAGGRLAWVTLGGAVTRVGTWSSLTSVAVMDADRDGDMDVVAGSLESPGVRWYRNDSGAPWSAVWPSFATTGVVSVAGGTWGWDGRIVAAAPTTVMFAARPFDRLASLPAASRVRMADLDGDGTDDLISLDAPTGTVRWWRGDPQQLVERIAATVSGATSVDVADLDRDRRPDLVLVSDTGGWLATLRNLGDGTFEAPRTLATGLPGLSRSAAGDLDGDGDLDVVCTIPTQNRVVLLDGRGDGTLDAAVTLANIFEPIDLAVPSSAGRAPDVVVAARRGIVLLPSPGYPDADGDGLSDATEAALGTDPSLADTDGDGLPDWQEAVGGLDPTDADTDGGGLQDGSEITEGRDPGNRGDDWENLPQIAPEGRSHVLVVDLDGDGVLDLLSGLDQVAWQQGLGGGVLAPAQTLVPVAGAGTWMVADVDGDGRNDVVASGVAGVRAWTHLLPGPATVEQVTTRPAWRMALADVDEDGAPELLLSGGQRGVDVATRQHDGRWTTAPAMVVGDGALGWGDLDGDGHGDLVAASGWELWWAQGDGRGGFGPARRAGPTDVAASTLEVADLDEDGRPDLVLELPGALDNRDLGILWNDGGTFELATYDAPHANPIQVADVDGDTLPDLVVGVAGLQESTLRVLPNVGGRRFDLPWTITPPSATWTATLAVGDLDGDGDRDAVSCEPSDTCRTAWNNGHDDTDHDGLADVFELATGTSSLDADTDGGGTPDGEERSWGTDPLDPADDQAMDRDHDGLTDAEELAAGTDPKAFDTDGDGVSDGRELALGSDPLRSDSDGDGAVDGAEVECATDPLDARDLDTDCDGLHDDEEERLGTDPGSADTDGDGLDDLDELGRGTDPLDPDTDGGGTFDGKEVATARDPLDAADDWAYHSVGGSEADGPLLLLDADEDGDDDLFVVAATTHVVWIERLADGHFGSSHEVWSSASPVTSLVAVDADGDGDRDLLVLTPSGATWLVRDGDFLEPKVLPLSPNPRVAVAADFDGDGDPDVLAANRRSVWSWVADGPLADGSAEDGWWQRDPEALIASPPGAYLVADRTLYALADGLAPSERNRVASFAHAPVVEVDLDGDGRDEVLFEGTGNALYATSPTDDGWSAPALFRPFAGQPNDVVVAQLDGSGPPELVVGTTGGLVVVWLEPERLVALDDAPVSHVLVTDIDGDGALDVIASGEGGTSWFRNTVPPGMPEESADTGEPPQIPRERGCGCASSPTTPMAAPWLALLALHPLRRRRSPRAASR